MARNLNKNNQTTDFLKNLEEKLKLKRGSFSATGEDVNPGAYRLPGKAVAQSLPFNPQKQQVDFQSLPQGEQFQYPETQPLPQMEQGGDRNAFTSDQLIDIVNTIRQDRGEAPVQDGKPRPVASQADGGTLYDDNIIRYPDGTEKANQPGATRQQAAYPVQQAPNGFLYSDGSVRSSTQVFTPRGFVPFQDFQSYLSGISGGQFGEQNITGEFGARYNFPSEMYNIGLDVALPRGQQQPSVYSPVNGQVVQVLRNPNQDFGASGPQAYGNSVLIRMANGEMLRFSHLSNQQLANFQEGDMISAGQYLGIVGDTGNTTGPHLDTEYYDAQGNLRSIREFVDRVTSDQAYRQSLAYSPEAFTDNSDVIRSLKGDEIVGAKDRNTGAYRSTTEELFKEQPNQSQENRIQNNQLQNPPQNQGLIGQVKGAATEAELGKIRPGEQKYGEQQIPGTDYGFTETVNKLGVQTSPGKIDIQTPTGKVNLPEIGSNPDGLTGRVSDIVQSIRGSITGKTKLDQEQGLAGTSEREFSTAEDISQKTTGDLVQSKILEGLQAARNMIKSSQLPESGVASTVFRPQAVYAQGLQTPAQPSDLQRGTSEINAPGTPVKSEIGLQSIAPMQSREPISKSNINKDVVSDTVRMSIPEQAPEKEYYIKSLKLSIPESQMSALTQRLYDMEQEGKFLDNNTKYAKLYKRHQDLFKQAESKLDPSLVGTEEGRNQILSQMTSNTATGYSDPRADAQAQAENAVKQSFYGGIVGDTGGSFEKYMEKIGAAGKSASEQAKALSSIATGKSAKDLQNYIAPLIPQDSGLYKAGVFSKKAADEVKRQTQATGDILSGSASKDIGNYIAPLIPRKSLDRLTGIEKLLKRLNPFAK